MCSESVNNASMSGTRRMRVSSACNAMRKSKLAAAWQTQDDFQSVHFFGMEHLRTIWQSDILGGISGSWMRQISVGQVLFQSGRQTGHQFLQNCSQRLDRADHVVYVVVWGGQQNTTAGASQQRLAGTAGTRADRGYSLVMLPLSETKNQTWKPGKIRWPFI